MKSTFFGSENSIFILGLEGRELFFLRDCRELWRREIEFANFEIVGVGNNGNVIIKSDEGILIYSPDPLEDELSIPVFRNEILKNENSSIAKIAMHRSGERICIEKVSYKSKLSEKLFKILSSSPRLERGQAHHELIFYEINSGKQVIFHKFTIDRKIPHSFTWNISPDFSYLIWGEAQKVFKGTETKFSAVDIREGSYYDQFVLEGLTDWIIFVNNFGSYLIDSPQRRDLRELLIGKLNARNYKISVTNEYHPTHMGKDFVAFESHFKPKLYFKRYDDSEIQTIDLSPLDDLSLDYQILYNEQDDINFVVKRDDEIKMVHTNIERLKVDSRRWKMMAEQQKVDKEIEKKRTVLEEKKKTLKDKRFQITAGELSRTAQESKSERAKKIKDIISFKRQELENLKLSFKTKKIDKTEYLITKHEIEQEINQLTEKEQKPEKEVKGKPENKLFKPLAGQKTPKVIQPPVRKKTRKLSLKEELSKYIPSVVDEGNEYQVPDHEEEVQEGKILLTKPIRMKGPSQHSPLLKSRDKRTPPPSSIKTDTGKVIPVPRKTSILPKFDKEFLEEARRNGGYERKPTPTPRSLDERKEVKRTISNEPKTEVTKLPTTTDKADSAKVQAPRTTFLPDIEVFKSIPEETKTDDEGRLNEIRRQIEREIQEAIIRKKRSGKHSEEQKKRYLKLIQELEESYKHGGISKENYSRLRNKYIERIRNLDE